MPFIIKCTLTHAGLLFVFWIANWYALQIKQLMPHWTQKIIGLVYIFLLIGISFLHRFISFKRSHYNPIESTPASKGKFIIQVAIYYLFICGCPILALSLGHTLPIYLIHYIGFVYLIILINYSDYSIPSFQRYLRLFYKNRWNTFTNI